MRQYVKVNGQLVEDKYVFPGPVGDSSVPSDGGMEFDSINSIYLKPNGSASFITTNRGNSGIDDGEQIGDILWFYKPVSLGDDYLLCNGQSYDIVKYPKLYKYLGSSNMPNLNATVNNNPTYLRGAGQNPNFNGGHTPSVLKEYNGGTRGEHYHNMNLNHSHHFTNGSHYHQVIRTTGNASGYLGYYREERFQTDNNYQNNNVTDNKKISLSGNTSSTDMSSTVTIGNPTQISGGNPVSNASNAGQPTSVYGVYYMRAK